MKAKLSLIAVVLLMSVFALPAQAKIFTVELPEFLGELKPHPEHPTAVFDFEKSFLQINEVRVRLVGTLIPGQAHGDGVWNPVDRRKELFPDIEVYMNTGDGYSFTFLYPHESPFDANDALELHHGGTWDFLLDGSGEVIAYYGYSIHIGWIIETEPTVDISEAYLIIDGVVPCETVVDITPETLNTKSQGKWITCKINLDGCDVNDIDTDSIKLADLVPAQHVQTNPGQQTITAKFDRSIVIDTLILQEGLDRNGGFNIFADVKVTGELNDGTPFEGTDKIRLMHNTKP